MTNAADFERIRAAIDVPSEAGADLVAAGRRH
jgi:hypothetical protein